MDHVTFPLTLTQNDIYLDQLRHDRSPLYNVGGSISFSTIDISRLADAHRKLVCASEIFGLRLSSTKDGIVQSICHTRTTSLTTLDFSKEERPVEAADEWQTDLFETVINIADAELFRACLLKIAEDRYRYVGLAHHIMMDGWGFANWAKLLCQLYNDPCNTAHNGIAWWQIAADDVTYLASEKYRNDRNYWAGHIEKISHSLLTPRYLGAFTDTLTIPSRRRIVELSRNEFRDFTFLAAGVGAGVAHHFLAMLAVYFATSSGQNRPVFGLPFHNRRGRSQKQMLGVFTSVSPLCIDMSDDERTFGELVQDICRQQKAGFRHQRYPLGHIIRDLAAVGDHRALYDVGFNYLKLGGDLSFAGTEAGLIYWSHNHEATPLMVTLCEYGEFGPVQLQLDYNLAYIDDIDISFLADRLLFLSRSLSGAYDRRISELNILPEHEVRRLLEGFGDSPLADSSNGCIHHLFEEQTKRTPSAIAVASGEKTLTYSELNKRANYIAHHLIRLGVKPESMVGICVERTMDMLSGVLGILKAGGAYVPLDQSYPPQRIQIMLEQSGIHLVLVHRHLSERIAMPTVRPVLIDEILGYGVQDSHNPDSAALGLRPSNVAYVIYTSGSTGKPKGVQICHCNAVALLDWVRVTYTVEELSRVLGSTSLSFDLSIFEMFAPLSVGGQCVVVRDALALLACRVEVSLINTVPSAMKMLIEQNAVPKGVRVINLAGEVLPLNIVNNLLSKQHCERVFNLYGPSEDTTYTTYAVFKETMTNTPNIGRAIPGTRLYILSPKGRLTPIGTIGELHIAGSGLARGYLKSPDMTADKFISNLFSEIGGERLYKTGDLVRYRADGALEYSGRVDDQVKIRGYRIEPEEIRQQLEQLDDVKTAVVLAREHRSSDKYLEAYVERKRKAEGTDMELSDKLWAAGLQRSLRKALPGYMDLASITVMSEIPLTPNGKVDKQALLAFDHEVTSQRECVAPRTRTEIKLAGLWAGLLGIDAKQVCATTSLFDLGGHSLLLVRLANEIRVEMGVNLSWRTLFTAVDLGDLADQIDTAITLQYIDRKMESAVIVSEGDL